MASLTPVIVTSWLDPPLQTDFQLGASVTWHATFRDRMTQQYVDPDIVNFIYSSPVQIPTTTLVYGASSIVRDQLGAYRYDLPLTVVGRWILTIAPQGNPGAVGIGNSSLEIQCHGTGQ
jgi:hypothetical protein